jgi:Multisubunit Na+/H+ antiporter, MnhE subunit
MRNGKIVLFVLLFAAWTLLSWSVDLEHIIAGVVISALIALLFGDLFTSHARRFLSPKRYLWFAAFVFVCLWDMIKANLDMAFRLLAPSLPVRPAQVEVKTTLTDETAQVFLANTLTLVQWMMTVDLDTGKRTLLVQCSNYNGDDAAAFVRPVVMRYERLLERVFE